VAALRSVRLRTTLGASLVVALALAIAGVVLVVGLRESLINDRREVAEARADEVVAQLEGVADPASIELADVDDQWIQVLDDTGNVLAASANAAGRPAVVRLEPDESAVVSTEIGDDASYVVVVAAAASPAEPLTVVVARGLDDVADSIEILSNLLAVSLPLLLVVLAFVTYVVVGRALAPVEDVRRRVESIDERDLERRVPVPATSDELARLTRTMNGLLDRLQAARDRQRRFVSDAAHELRSPLAAIRQHAEVAVAHPEQQSTSELGRAVLDEETRLQQLVEDLVLLARSDEGATSAREEIDLDDLVLEEVRRLKATPGNSLRLEFDMTQVSAGRVRGDGGALRRMVGNLLDNAARHARSTVSVSLAATAATQVVLRVDDDGPGVPNAERARIFERFVRLDAARSRGTGGSGLGLAIVAEVVAAHGGTVEALESPGGGARFEVSLPGS
jgi:signal transduction histidine kinase